MEAGFVISAAYINKPETGQPIENRRQFNGVEIQKERKDCPDAQFPDWLDNLGNSLHIDLLWSSPPGPG